MDQASEGQKDAKRPAVAQEQTGGQPTRRQRQPSQPAQQPPWASHQQTTYAVAAGQQQRPPISVEYPSNVPVSIAAGYSTRAAASINPSQQDRQSQMAYPPQQQQQAVYASGYPVMGAQSQSVATAAASRYPQQQGQSLPQPAMYYQVPPTGATGLRYQQLPPVVSQQPYLEPRIGRLPADRPIAKLSVSLIDTYKHINSVYYEEREARRKKKAEKGQGVINNGWDDENYDYIVTSGEVFFGRYNIKERIGKGSFGQVVRAEDIETNQEVAIKIIKSKKPFALQAKTEIELLTHLLDKDVEDQHNVVRLLTHFVYRGHQCLVFEMLSLNLYELLKNTQFSGVSLNLIRKFAKQVLKALSFLARPDVDVIHCDLKPENILLRHPKKSGVKVIDFGSSCRSNKRMYSYIQSRFYRSPEVILGLPYGVAIDMWSLGCILAEMHTGEPVFSGSDQFDQMQKIVKILGMIPNSMLNRSSSQTRNQFFQRKQSTVTGREEWTIRQVKKSSSSLSSKAEPEPPEVVVVPSVNPVSSLTEVITAGANQKKKFPQSEAYNTQRNYELFVDLVYKMLAYEPDQRITPAEAMAHPFIAEIESIISAPASATSVTPMAMSPR